MAIDPRPQRHKAARSRIYDPGSSAEALVSITGALKTAIPESLIEGIFTGSSLDIAVWAEATAGTGANTVDLGVASMSTGASAGGATKIVSVEQGISTFGETFEFSTGVYGNIPLAGNIRRWGVMDALELNGLFFEMSDEDFFVVSRRAGVDSKVSVAVFNHDKTFTPTTKNAMYVIRYSDDRAIFQVNDLDVLRTLHIMIDQDYSLIEEYELGIYFENTNVANTTDVEMRVRGGSLSLLGNIPLNKVTSAPVTVTGVAVITTFYEDSVTGVATSPATATIITQAFISGTFEKIMKIRVSGTNYAKYFFKVNGVTVETLRTGPNLNETFEFSGAPYDLASGDTVTVTVEHFNVGTVDFESTIYGAV